MLGLEVCQGIVGVLLLSIVRARSAALAATVRQVHSTVEALGRIAESMRAAEGVESTGGSPLPSQP